MYIARTEVTIDGAQEAEYVELHRSMHESMRPMAGFRWAMLLRSLDTPSKLAAVAMWQTPAGAESWNVADVRGYDVVTARGAMTPAGHAVIVDWTVDAAHRAGFANRWNATYHAIEDAIGSRLLQDLKEPERYTGLHVTTTDEAMQRDVFTADITDGEALRLQPDGVERFDVILLTEA